ncbi:hypothetical protein J2S55_007498 [Streptosporangium brasiliense]|uniref:F5/8 type C domain-containing protein n=1 Tax=Streptosporangium brasiliense TaxID=47480 RepID=A0ABT9RG36_9ACTN|nr:hypothetical protein [Streptosporangium brasiliense]
MCPEQGSKVEVSAPSSAARVRAEWRSRCSVHGPSGRPAVTLSPGADVPSTGCTATVAKNASWIRVDLAKAEHGRAVFCLGGKRRTDTWAY